MHKTFNIITITITISLTVVFLTSNLQNSYEQLDNAGNWTIGESEEFNFTYPSKWNVNVSDSRFDNYELLFFDLTSNTSIQISNEAISNTNKILMGGDPQKYIDIYMISNSPLSSTAKKIEVYPKGKVSIAGLPAYSELYLDRGFAVLISLAFPEGNDSHYTIISASPSTLYDDIEPTMFKIIKSITPKTFQKPLDYEGEVSSKSKDVIEDLSKYAEQIKKECLARVSEIICNFLLN